MKTGLVLEGGAMRGMFTAGVLDVWMENGIIFDGAIAVSAGATFGCNLKSYQPYRVLRYNKKYCQDWRYCSFRSLFLTGDLYGAEFDYDRLPKKLDVFDTTTFKQDPMDFYVVATDAKTGDPLYHLCVDGKDNDLTWIRGSASIPVFARPVHVDGYTIYDGGVADPIPYKKMFSLGYKKQVVLLTQPASYRKQPQKNMNALRVLLKRYPEVIKDLEHRHTSYNATLDAIQVLEEQKKLFVIRPKEPLNIGSICHDPNELDRVYKMGRLEAVKQLKALKAFLEEE